MQALDCVSEKTQTRQVGSLSQFGEAIDSPWLALWTGAPRFTLPCPSPSLEDVVPPGESLQQKPTHTIWPKDANLCGFSYSPGKPLSDILQPALQRLCECSL